MAVKPILCELMLIDCGVRFYHLFQILCYPSLIKTPAAFDVDFGKVLASFSANRSHHLLFPVFAAQNRKRTFP
jgi:hypothetical protein